VLDGLPSVEAELAGAALAVPASGVVGVEAETLLACLPSGIGSFVPIDPPEAPVQAARPPISPIAKSCLTR